MPLKKLPASLATALISFAAALHASSANAVVVSMDGSEYEISAFRGAYDDNISKFGPLETGGSMPWWNDQDLARKFAAAVAGQIGSVNLSNGPLFAYQYPSIFGPSFIDSMSYGAFSNTVSYTGTLFVDASRVWAVGSRYAPAVPGPLPVVGSLAACCISRRLRHRIKSRTL
jgi:hypothetical protein